MTSGTSSEGNGRQCSLNAAPSIWKGSGGQFDSGTLRPIYETCMSFTEIRQLKPPPQGPGTVNICLFLHLEKHF